MQLSRHLPKLASKACLILFANLRRQGRHQPVHHLCHQAAAIPKGCGLLLYGIGHDRFLTAIFTISPLHKYRFSAAFSNEHSFGTGIADFIGVKTMWKRRCKVYFLIKVGPAPRTKGSDKINLIRLGLLPLLKKTAFPEKPFRFGTVFARFLLVKNLWIGE
jgi:hypothetical protein